MLIQGLQTAAEIKQRDPAAFKKLKERASACSPLDWDAIGEIKERKRLVKFLSNATKIEQIQSVRNLVSRHDLGEEYEIAEQRITNQ